MRDLVRSITPLISHEAPKQYAILDILPRFRNLDFHSSKLWCDMLYHQQSSILADQVKRISQRIFDLADPLWFVKGSTHNQLRRIISTTVVNESHASGEGLNGIRNMLFINGTKSWKSLLVAGLYIFASLSCGQESGQAIKCTLSRYYIWIEDVFKSFDDNIKALLSWTLMTVQKYFTGPADFFGGYDEHLFWESRKDSEAAAGLGGTAVAFALAKCLLPFTWGWDLMFYCLAVDKPLDEPNYVPEALNNAHPRGEQSSFQIQMQHFNESMVEMTDDPLHSRSSHRDVHDIVKDLHGRRVDTEGFEIVFQFFETDLDWKEPATLLDAACDPPCLDNIEIVLKHAAEQVQDLEWTQQFVSISKPEPNHNSLLCECPRMLEEDGYSDSLYESDSFVDRQARDQDLAAKVRQSEGEKKEHKEEKKVKEEKEEKERGEKEEKGSIQVGQTGTWINRWHLDY